MTLLRPFSDFWDFWAKPIRAESLALFRILLAVTILGSQLTGVMRTLPQTCAPGGYCPIDANDEWLTRGGRLSLLRGPGHGSVPLLGKWLPDWLVKDWPWLDGLQNWLSPEAAAAWSRWGEQLSSHYLLYGIFLLSLVTLALGLGSRLSALVAALLAATFYHRLPWLANGGDSLFRNGLYFLVLAPAGATWSLDRLIGRRLRRRLGWPVSDEPVLIAPWSVRLMQLQVCCMYLFTGLVKLGDSDVIADVLVALLIFFGSGVVLWPLDRLLSRGIQRSLGWPVSDRVEWLPLLLWLGRQGLLVVIGYWIVRTRWAGQTRLGDYVDGQALYWALNDVALTRWPFGLLPIPLFVCRILSWMTILFEVGFSFLVWVRPLRRWVLLMGVGLHLGILLMMEIGWFSQVTLCWYVLFVSGESVSRFVERVGAWLRGSPPQPATVPAAA